MLRVLLACRLVTSSQCSALAPKAPPEVLNRWLSSDMRIALLHRSRPHHANVRHRAQSRVQGRTCNRGAFELDLACPTPSWCRFASSTLVNGSASPRMDSQGAMHHCCKIDMQCRRPTSVLYAVSSSHTMQIVSSPSPYAGITGRRLTGVPARVRWCPRHGCHLTLQPMLAGAAGGGLPSIVASSAARRSRPVTSLPLFGRASSNCAWYVRRRSLSKT